MAGFIAPSADRETPSPTKRVGTEKGRATTTASAGFIAPEADRAAPVEKSMGRRVGEQLVDVAKGTVELPASIVTGGLANIAGNVAGGYEEYVTNPLKRLVGMDAAVTDPAATRRKIIEEGTYTPRSTSGRASQEALGVILKPIAAVGEFAGDVVKGAGGSEFAGDLTGDIVMSLAGGGAAKAAPAVARGTVAAGKKAASTVGAGVKLLDEVYTPQMQKGVAAGHLAAGDVPGAIAQYGTAKARELYKSVRERNATPSAIKEATTVGEALAQPTIPGVTTKAEGAAIRAKALEARAANQARLAAEGRNVRSTMYDTAETQRAMEPQKPTAVEEAVPTTVAEAIATPVKKVTASNTAPVKKVPVSNAPVVSTPETVSAAKKAAIPEDIATMSVEKLRKATGNTRAEINAAQQQLKSEFPVSSFQGTVVEKLRAQQQAVRAAHPEVDALYKRNEALDARWSQINAERSTAQTTSKPRRKATK